MKNYSNT